jgi:hypothetical protein
MDGAPARLRQGAIDRLPHEVVREIEMPFSGLHHQAAPHHAFQPGQHLGYRQARGREQFRPKLASHRGAPREQLAHAVVKRHQSLADQRIEAAVGAVHVKLCRTRDFDEVQGIAAGLAQRVADVDRRRTEQRAHVHGGKRAQVQALCATFAQQRLKQALGPRVVLDFTAACRAAQQDRNGGVQRAGEEMQQGRRTFVDPLQVIEQQN